MTLVATLASRHPIDVARLGAQWQFEPAAAACLLAAAAVYEKGRRTLRRQAHGQRLATRQRAVLLWCGLASVAFALFSPLGALDEVSVSAHMGEHMIIGLAAPLLIVASRPLAIGAWALPAGSRRAAMRWVRRRGTRWARSSGLASIAAVAFHVGSWWIWHLPPLYGAAIETPRPESSWCTRIPDIPFCGGAGDFAPLLHLVEHAMLFASGAALWWVAAGRGWEKRCGQAILALFAATVGTGMLAALMVLASHPIYGVSPELAGWGLNAVSDQQLAGALMWVPGGLLYLGVASALMVR